MDSEKGDEGGKRIKAIQRSFAMIEVLRESGTMRITDVAETLDMPISTTHVHLKTLESVGYVVRDKDGYRLGLRFLRNGVTARNRLNIYTIAKSEVDDLAATTNEVANLGVEEDGKRVLLYQAEGSEAVYDNAPTGEYTNMHWTALGKAILAERPHEYIEQYIEAYGLPAQTENTITNPDKLFTELASVSDQGFALEDEERRDGIRSIAVPIIVEDSVVGSISLSGPRERFNDQRIEDELLPEAQNTANIIEVKYAYR